MIFERLIAWLTRKEQSIIDKDRPPDALSKVTFSCLNAVSYYRKYYLPIVSALNLHFSREAEIAFQEFLQRNGSPEAFLAKHRNKIDVLRKVGHMETRLYGDRILEYRSKESHDVLEFYDLIAGFGRSIKDIPAKFYEVSEEVLEAFSIKQKTIDVTRNQKNTSSFLKDYFTFLEESLTIIESCYLHRQLGNHDGKQSLWELFITTRPLAQGEQQAPLVQFNAKKEFYSSNTAFVYNTNLLNDYITFIDIKNLLKKNSKIQKIIQRLTIEILIFFDFFAEEEIENTDAKLSQVEIVDRFLAKFNASSNISHTSSTLRYVFHLSIVRGISFTTNFSNLKRGLVDLTSFQASPVFAKGIRTIVEFYRTGFLSPSEMTPEMIDQATGLKGFSANYKNEASLMQVAGDPFEPIEFGARRTHS